MWCSYCGSTAHTKALCPHTAAGQSARLHLRCTYCGSREHAIEACPKTYSGSAARAWYPGRVADFFKKD